MTGETGFDAPTKRFESSAIRRVIGGLAVSGLATFGVSAHAQEGHYIENDRPPVRTDQPWDEIEWTTTYRDDFDRKGGLGPDWSIAEPLGWHDGWDMFDPANVYTDGKNAVFKVDRRCVTDESDSRIGVMPQVQPCAPGLTDVYTGARVQQSEFQMHGAFRVLVKATLPRKNPVDGVRSANWILNDQPRCDAYSQTDTVEIDTSEYIRSKQTKNKPFSTVHAGCDNLDFDVVYHKAKYEKGWDKRPHVYETIYTGPGNGDRIVFKIDGEIVAETNETGWQSLFVSPKDFEDTERSEFNRMMNNMFGVILSADTVDGQGAYRPPDSTKNFPPQLYKVDWVKTMEPVE